MTPERLQTIETIFHSARELEPSLRSSFLDQACSTDEELRAEIEALLNAHESADGFIAKPAPEIAAEVLAKEQAALVVGRMFGHYQLLEPLGRGGMGEVYLAADTRSGRKAALKLLPLRFTGDAERFNRFQQEARTVIALNHPNIVTIYEIGEDDSTHYIVSELIEGETLQQRLARGRMELSEALDIALQVASALAAAHRAGIVHRDIKPENIMLRPDGYVKVLDFGIAKLAEESEPAALTKEEAPLLLIETSAGQLLGTARYMSPEQARGLPVDERTDIWSLGVVLYEMVAGCTPFRGGTPTDVINSILTAAPSTLTGFRPDVSADLQQIVAKALRKDRQERYGSVDEMAEALKDLRRNLEAGGQTKPAWRRWKVTALLLTLLVAALAVSLPLFWLRSKSRETENIPSIAVLPFENFSEEKANEYLSDGITEDLCTALSQIKGLHVPARTSSFVFKGKTEDIRKIGEQLHVGTVLEGSVSKAGNKLRISAQLINVANGFHLWAANYDREMTDILEIRSDISRRVVEALKVQLGVEETERLTKKPTETTEAYEVYLLGRYELNKFTEAGFTNAVAHFKRAIAMDPSFAIATAGLAEAYNMLGYWNYLPPKEAFPEAKKAAEQALELDPALAEAHMALAYSRFQYEWKFKEAEMEFKGAIRLNPSSVDARLGFWEYLIDLGRAQDAHEQLERARELDPLSVRVSFLFAAESFAGRDFDRAAERLQKTICMDPNNAFAYDFLEAVLWRQNMPAQAFEASEKTNALEGIFSQQEMADMRKAYEVSGYSGYLRKENELRQQHLTQGKYESPLIIALAYARAGANSEALDWLEKAAEERTPWLPELKVDPTWDALRSDPRFIAVLKKIGLENESPVSN